MLAATVCRCAAIRLFSKRRERSRTWETRTIIACPPSDNMFLSEALYIIFGITQIREHFFSMLTKKRRP